MSDVQHTITVRIGKQQMTINCPPYLSPEALDVMLMSYRDEHPDHKIISKSWRSNAPIQPK